MVDHCGLLTIGSLIKSATGLNVLRHRGNERLVSKLQEDFANNLKGCRSASITRNLPLQPEVGGCIPQIKRLANTLGIGGLEMIRSSCLGALSVVALISPASAADLYRAPDGASLKDAPVSTLA